MSLRCVDGVPFSATCLAPSKDTSDESRLDNIRFLGLLIGYLGNSKRVFMCDAKSYLRAREEIAEPFRRIADKLVFLPERVDLNDIMHQRVAIRENVDDQHLPKNNPHHHVHQNNRRRSSLLWFRGINPNFASFIKMTLFYLIVIACGYLTLQHGFLRSPHIPRAGHPWDKVARLKAREDELSAIIREMQDTWQRDRKAWEYQKLDLNERLSNAHREISRLVDKNRKLESLVAGERKDAKHHLKEFVGIAADKSKELTKQFKGLIKNSAKYVQSKKIRKAMRGIKKKVSNLVQDIKNTRIEIKYGGKL